MTKFGKDEGGVISQVQRYDQNGFIEIAENVVPGFVLVNGAYEKPSIDVPVHHVETERDRRLAACDFTYDFGDVRGVHTIGTDEKDMQAWMMEVMPLAVASLFLSDTTPINIVTNTGPALVTPIEWMDIVREGARISTGRQAIWGYYFALINTDPIPADYADDQYWSPPAE